MTATAARWLARWASVALDPVFPVACLLCGADGTRLCIACRDEATAGLRHACVRCAIPLALAQDGTPCGRCLRRAPAFDGTLAAALFEAPFAQLIRGLKYGANLAYAPTLANLLVARVVGSVDAVADVILPVPLSRERLASRGFNQSIELGRIVARQLGKPLDVRSVLRIHDTPPQAALPLQARRRNIRGAFAVIDARKAHLAGRHVALVDDVMTTGATLDELARTLKRAGVASVHNYVVARTP